MLKDVRMTANDQRLIYVEERLDARIQRLEDRVDARFDAVDTRFAVLEAKFDVRFDAVDRKMMWLIGIVTTALIAQIAGLLAVVNALLTRGGGG